MLRELAERDIAAHFATANLLGREIVGAVAASFMGEADDDATCGGAAALTVDERVASAGAWSRARISVFVDRATAGCKSLRDAGLAHADALILDDQPLAWRTADRARVLAVRPFRVVSVAEQADRRAWTYELTYLDRLVSDMRAGESRLPNTAATRAFRAAARAPAAAHSPWRRAEEPSAASSNLPARRPPPRPPPPPPPTPRHPHSSAVWL